jgi:streptogramin lyase
MKKNTIFRYCASLALGLALSSNLCASYNVTTVAGVVGDTSIVDGVGTTARFFNPGMLSITHEQNLLVSTMNAPSESQNFIRQVTTAGGIYTVSTLLQDVNAPLQAVCEHTTSGTTSILTTDEWDSLKKWTQNGGIYVPTSILYASPAWGLVIGSSNNIFMTSSANNRIYKILPDGSYSIFAENSALNGLTGITIDSSSNLYVSATSNNTICKITPAGVVTTIAGTAGSSGSTDGVSSSAQFNSPWDIDIDAAGNLYVADRGNNLIRKLTNSSGTYTVSTIAGLAGSTGSADGTGLAARFNAPTGLAVDASGNIFVTDTGNDTIRRLAPPSLTIEVDGAASASHSGAISVGILNKTNAGSLALSSTSNAIGNLDIQGGLVSVTSAGNLNGASSAVTFAASGIDPATGFPNTATLEIAGTMNTGALAFTSNGTVQVDGSNVATLNTAPHRNRASAQNWCWCYESGIGFKCIKHPSRNTCR